MGCKATDACQNLKAQNFQGSDPSRTQVGFISGNKLSKSKLDNLSTRYFFHIDFEIKPVILIF